MMFGMILGNVVINASAVGILTALSGGSSNYTQSAFIIMAIILSVVSLLGSILTYVTTKEIPDEEKRSRTKRVNIKKVFLHF